MQDWHAWIRGGRHVDAGGHRIWWRSDGSGPTLLFVHGFPTSSHDWAPIVEALAPRFRCVTFDLLGFGASAKPRIAYTFAAQLAAVDAVVAAAGVTDAVLVGHDYGATIVELLLAREPGALRPRGAIFMNGGIVPALHRPRPVQRFLASRIGHVVGPYLLGRRALARSMAGVCTRVERLPLDDMWQAIDAGDGRRVLPALMHYMAERTAREAELVGALTRSRVPLAFFWGLDDPVSGAHVHAWIRAHLPDATVRALDGVGHYPMLEATPECIDFIAARAAAWTS